MFKFKQTFVFAPNPSANCCSSFDVIWQLLINSLLTDNFVTILAKQLPTTSGLFKTTSFPTTGS